MGYYYKQLEGDDGNLIGNLSADNFKGRGAGIGPAVIYNFKTGGRTVSLIGKALYDVDAEKRYDGNLYMLSTDCCRWR